MVSSYTYGCKSFRSITTVSNDVFLYSESTPAGVTGNFEIKFMQGIMHFPVTGPTKFLVKLRRYKCV